MIFKNNELGKRTENNKIFLFHGVNDGHKEEILQNIFKPKFGKNVLKYFENDVLSNKNNFYNEILSKNYISIGKELSFTLNLDIGDSVTLMSSAGPAAAAGAAAGADSALAAGAAAAPAVK